MTPAFRRRHGVKTLFIVLTVAVVAAIATIKSVVSYEGMARREFGGRARVESIVECFERIERRPSTDFIAVTDETEDFGFSETRMIPPSEIPKELADEGWGSSIAAWKAVLAHYDVHHKLCALEFYGSRYGAFVSRDPALRPTMEGELKQLAGSPVFVTARITGEPD